MDETLNTLKLSAVIMLTSNYIGKNGLDISDEDFEKLFQITDKIVSHYVSI